MLYEGKYDFIRNVESIVGKENRVMLDDLVEPKTYQAERDYRTEREKDSVIENDRQIRDR